MSQEKAQLIAPIDSSFTVPGVTVSGVITATSFDGTITGVADSITQGTNLNVGVVTALSFAGNLTGNAGGLTGSPNTVAGVVTATSFVGGLTGNITGDVIGNATGVGASIKEGQNLNVGIATAWKWYGDGSLLTGAGVTAFIAQEVTASGDETIIDLTYGNLIYFDQTTASTTVGFASTAATQEISIVRDTDSITPSFTTGSVDFDGTDDILQTSTSTDYQLGTNSFTVEAWIYNENPGENRCIAEFAQGTNAYYGALFLYQNDSGATYKFWASSDGSNWDVAAGQSFGAVVANKWEHFAIARDGNTFYGFRNGEQKWTFTSSASLYQNVNQITIGRSQSALGGTPYFEGKISNFRFVKGTALYTSDFDVSYADLTNVTNTKLLCCQSDSSATAATVGSVSETSSPTAGSVTITSSSTATPSITWPDRITWNGGSAPTLISDSQAAALQVFRFLSVDSGLNYNAWEEMKNDPAGPYQLFGWGSNVTAAYGQLGQNDNVSQSSPTQVGTEDTWTNGVAVGHHEQATVGFIKTDGTLWMWGSNYNSGQLGQNQATAQLDGKSSPTQIPGTTWATVSCGDKCEIMTKTDGTLWSLGINEQGQLGLNDIVNRSSPTQVGTDTDWGNSKIWGNGGRVVKSDNTLWVWGSAWGGGLGLNSWVQRSSPTQLPGSWTDVRTGGTNLGVKTDGTLWSWGYTGNGMSGLNVRNGRYSSPTQIGTDTDWGSKVFVGNNNAGALKADGSLWMWGKNDYGNIAQNESGPAYKSSPTQVGTSTDWADAAIGREYTIATKTDGTLWAWGYNVSGQAGTNTTPAGGGPNYSSPIQVGTDTGWVNPYVTREGSWALRQV